MELVKRVAFYTLGCKVNKYETDSMIDLFKKADYDIVSFNDVADIYVVNTCTVTGHGDKKSRHIIYKAKRTNRNAKVIVTGCLAQIAKKENKHVSGADLLIGTEERKHIVDIIEDRYKDEFTGMNQNTQFWESGGISSEERTRAYVKIEDGCDRYCTYCIIPYARGPVRSRKREDIVNEVEKLAEKGFLEVVLIGIHLASYGKDLRGISLIDVLKDINKIEGIKRIRLGSLEPTFIDEESIKELKNVSKLCKHFHLSLQSGCDETLKRMNRKYTTAEYRHRIFLLRENFEDVAITTDIITGFPGETEQEFDTTYNFLKDIKLSKLHVFPYSKRKGTVAESMQNQVPEEIKDIRTKKLISLSDENEKEFKKRFIGKEMEVILEKKEQNGYKQGYNEQYVSVFIKKGKATDFIKVVGDKENLQIID